MRVLLATLLGTVAILGTQLLLAAALAGIGALLRRAVAGRPGVPHPDADRAFLDFWVGLGSVVLFLLLWNLVLPIHDATLGVVLAAGAAGLWLARADFQGLTLRRLGWGRGIVLLGAGLWVANLSLGQLDNYDSALYHLQAVRWAEQYPAVPGLGNLDGPLAFNNANLLFDALLSAGPWQGHANHLANGLLILVAMWQALVNGARVVRRTAGPPDVFRFLLLAPAAAMALYGRVSSFVTDLAPSLAILLVAALLYESLATPTESPDRARGRYRFFAVGVLLAMAVTFKSNAGMFAAAAFPTAWFAARRRGELNRARDALPALLAVVAFAAAWMGRGMVLSGYPLFPVSVAGLDVDWRVPREHADAELAYIIHSGRASTQNLPVVAGEAGAFAWLPRWIGHTLDDPYDIAIPLALVVCGVAGLAFRRRSTGPSPPVRPGILAVPAVLAILAWLVSAPEPRYALPFFWSLGALAWSELFRRRAVSGRSWRDWSIGLVLLGASPLIVSPAFALESRFRRDGVLVAILKSNLNRAPADGLLQPHAEQPGVVPYRTRSGLVINTVRARCWDAAVPCTPNPAPNLRLREPGNLARGFAVDGPWQMENWPMWWQPEFLAAWRRSRSSGD